MEMLGFQRGSKPKKIGSGSFGCVYTVTRPAAPGSDKAVVTDSIVKITKDENDALVAWKLKQANGSAGNWAVPIYAVYRLPHKTFAICAAKAEPLTEDWAGPIEMIYRYADEEKLESSGWEAAYKDIVREIEYKEVEHGMPTQDDRNMRRALSVINTCVLEFRKLGLSWVDFHDFNFMMYGGRPVVIDLGADESEEAVLFGQTEELPEVKSIPVLPF